MILFFISMTVFVYFFAHSLIVEKIEFNFYWNKGKIPTWKKKSDEARIYIYVSLAGLLLEKSQLIQNHPKIEAFYKFMAENKRVKLSMGEKETYYKQLRNMLNYAQLHPIQFSTVSEWLENQQIADYKKKQVLEFLVNFSDTGIISDQNRRMLISIAETLHFPTENLQQIIADHLIAEKQTKEERSAENRLGAKAGIHYKYCNLLEVSTNATWGEIKKAYRQMVLRYHPDKFQNETEDVYVTAQKKFVEIKHAFEMLEKELTTKRNIQV